MKRRLEHVLPDSQRRTLDELTAELDLSHGDRTAKRSAFWTMLTLSAVIASAGVLGDSTATVIGAMIVAPLSTPIMGIGLDIVKRRRSGAVRTVAAGSLLVVAIGVAFSLVLPDFYDLLANSQIASRTSPGLVDVVAAAATGLAGAVALARRDVAAVLPGVAIAISLVPPLAVVGVCLGQGGVALAAGAALLFFSNLLALVLAGTLVFAALGYSEEAREDRPVSRRRAYLTLAVLVTLVVLPLTVNTLVTYVIARWHGEVQQVAETWASSEPDVSVTSVDNHATTFVIHVRTESTLPPTDDLMTELAKVIPDGVEIVVQTTLGRRIELGAVGSS